MTDQPIEQAVETQNQRTVVGVRFQRVGKLYHFDYSEYPSLQTGEARARADKYLKGGYGALVGFELKGGSEAGRRFIDALQMFYHVANIGDARSLAIHPATTTHSQLAPEEQLKTGVTEGYVRLSIGLEHIEDILADLERGLKAAG